MFFSVPKDVPRELLGPPETGWSRFLRCRFDATRFSFVDRLDRFLSVHFVFEIFGVGSKFSIVSIGSVGWIGGTTIFCMKWLWVSALSKNINNKEVGNKLFLRLHVIINVYVHTFERALFFGPQQQDGQERQDGLNGQDGHNR